MPTPGRSFDCAGRGGAPGARPPLRDRPSRGGNRWRQGCTTRRDREDCAPARGGIRSTRRGASLRRRGGRDPASGRGPMWEQKRRRPPARSTPQGLRAARAYAVAASPGVRAPRRGAPPGPDPQRVRTAALAAGREPSPAGAPRLDRARPRGGRPRARHRRRCRPPERERAPVRRFRHPA